MMTVIVFISKHCESELLQLASKLSLLSSCNSKKQLIFIGTSDWQKANKCLSVFFSSLSCNLKKLPTLYNHLIHSLEDI